MSDTVHPQVAQREGGAAQFRHRQGPRAGALRHLLQAGLQLRQTQRIAVAHDRHQQAVRQRHGHAQMHRAEFANLVLQQMRVQARMRLQRRDDCARQQRRQRQFMPAGSLHRRAQLLLQSQRFAHVRAERQ